MARFRGVARTKGRYVPQYKKASGLVLATLHESAPALRPRREGIMGNPSHQSGKDPQASPLRGRTLWMAYYGGQSVSFRAPAATPHQTIRRMLIEHLGYNPGEIQLVQAGGFGQFFDEADSQLTVDIDLTVTEESHDEV